MEYYERLINSPGCVCRPLLTAEQEDDEIARPQGIISEQQSIIDSLKWANKQLQMLLTLACAKGMQTPEP